MNEESSRPAATGPSRHILSDTPPLTRTEYWRLTIHYFPEATAAGRTPVPHDGFEREWQPQWYKPHDIDFSSPPSRDDLLAVVAQTPWMHGWGEDLLPLIAQNQWPMIEPCHKGASADLKDSSGNTVGRLDVWRQWIYCNSSYSVPMVLDADTQPFLNRRIRDPHKRQAARQYLRAHRNLILERLAAGGDHSPTQILDESERVLVQGGFIAPTGLTPSSPPAGCSSATATL